MTFIKVRFRKNILLLIILLIISSCDVFDTHKHITGHYYIINDKFGKALCYQVNTNGECIRIIDGGFGAIGFDEHYIIVRVDNYDYRIIPIYQNTYSPEKDILGPLSLNEFNKQKNILKIKAKFSINTN